MDRAAFLQLTVRLSRHTHSYYPKHLILRFELFCSAFLFGKLFYKSVIHLLCFFIDVGKVIYQLASGEQIIVENLMVLSRYRLRRCPQIPTSLGSCSGSFKLGKL